MPKPKIFGEKLKLEALTMIVALLMVVASPTAVLAAVEAGGGGGGGSSGNTSSTSNQGGSLCSQSGSKNCNLNLGKAESTCKDTLGSGDKASPQKVNTCVTNDPIIVKVNQIVDVLSAAVGIVVVAVIIAGGIQYSLAGGSSEAVTKAKDRMMNGFIALIVYLFAFAILQWLIPGGISP